MSVQPKATWKAWAKTQSVPVAAPQRLTAADLSKQPHFTKACLDLGVKPTKRQARKYMAQTGRWANHFNNRVVSVA